MKVNFIKIICMVMERLSPNMGKSMKEYGQTTIVKNGYAGKNSLYRIKILFHLNKDWKNLKNIKLQLTPIVKIPQ